TEPLDLSFNTARCFATLKFVRQNTALIVPDVQSAHSKRSVRAKFANEFALELLLPVDSVALALSRIRAHAGLSGNLPGDIEIAQMSRIFGVSIHTAALRLELLDLLPKGSARSLKLLLDQEFGGGEA